jgi:hypothetical protein
LRALTLREEIPLIDWMRLTSHGRQAEAVKESSKISDEIRQMITRKSTSMQSGELEMHQSESNKDEEESIRLEDLEGCCGEQGSEIWTVLPQKGLVKMEAAWESEGAVRDCESELVKGEGQIAVLKKAFRAKDVKLKVIYRGT